MSKVKGITAQKGAASQFVGTEHPFVIASTETWRLVEVLIKLGSEAKIWSVVKTDTSGNVFTLASSISATTDTFVFISQFELDARILPGESVGIVTSGATSDMSARIYIEIQE